LTLGFDFDFEQTVKEHFDHSVYVAIQNGRDVKLICINIHKISQNTVI